MRLASIKQTLAYLGGSISRTTLQTLVRNNAIRSTKLSSKILIDLDSLDEYLKDRMTGKPPDPPDKPPYHGRTIDLW